MSCTGSMRAENGSITVAAAIFLSSIILLNTVLIDYVSMKTKTANISTELRLACKSILASYDALLAEKYNLYGYNNSSVDSAHKEFISYYKAVDSAVMFKNPFTEPEIIKKQIFGIMKFKTPERLIESVLQALDIVSSADKSCDEHDACGRAAQKLLDMQELQEKLKLKVEGFYQGDPACVNGYSQGIVIQILENDKSELFLSKLIAIHKQYLQYNNEAAVLYNELKNIKTEIDSTLLESLNENYDEKTFENASNIRKQAESLLNKAAFNSIVHNCDVLNERIKLLEALDSNQVVSLEQLKAIVKKGKINTNIRINTVYGGDGAGFSDERETLFGEIEKTVKNSAFYDDKYEIPDMEYAMLPSVRNEAEKEKMKILLDMSSDSFMDKFSSFENMFSYWDDITFEKLTEDATEAVLIDDYILTFMTSRLSGASDEKLNNEIEYIICGNKSCDSNNDAVEQKIVALRFILNFTQIMKDKEKVSIAEAMAAAIAAVISRGAGISLYKYIIISAWSLIDSYIDLENLLKGKAVPLLEINDGEMGNKINELQDYGFYLRLLLLFSDKETKLLRICDVIEINMKECTGENYKLSTVYNTVSVRAFTKFDFISPVLLGIENNFKREDYCEISY